MRCEYKINAMEVEKMGDWLQHTRDVPFRKSFVRLDAADIYFSHRLCRLCADLCW